MVLRATASVAAAAAVALAAVHVFGSTVGVNAAALPPHVTASQSVAIDVDIHLPVQGYAEEAVLWTNQYLNKRLNTTAVDFATVDTPHVTLYLTSFSCPSSSGGGITYAASDCVASISEAVNETLMKLASELGPCNVAITDVFPEFTYAMGNVTLGRCLQTYSDAIVNAT